MSLIPQVAVLVPCLNEESAIGKVIADFRAVLPNAAIFVYDNGSTDRTIEIAKAAGAVVRKEPLKGKGNVMRRMFADVEADIYVLVDGDDTYDAQSAPILIEELIANNLDMVNGARAEDSQLAYRAGHRFGNRLLTGLVAWFFGARFTDMLSGYRVMSRRFIKSFPALASGFEIVEEQLIDERHPRPVGVGEPGELVNLAAGGERPAVVAGVAAHPHDRAVRVGAGLLGLIGACGPDRLGDQRDRQFFADLAQQGLQIAFRAFALPAGDVENVLPARPGTTAPTAAQR